MHTPVTATLNNTPSLYQVTYQPRTDYLYAFIEGETDSLDISMDYWNQVLATARAKGFGKVLVRENFPNNPPIFDMHYFIDYFCSLPYNDIKVAFVDDIDDHFDNNLFGEQLATKRGLIVRLCANEADAINWLTQDYPNIET